MPETQNTLTTDQITNSLSIKLVKIQGGSFMMGSDEYKSEQPIHQVKLADFYMGQTPITVAQYLAFAEATQSNYPQWLEKGSEYHLSEGTNDRYSRFEHISHPESPIVGVSWENATAFCEWLSRESGHKYQLPSEAQWEYAARGGQKSKGLRYAGSNKLKEVGWYNQNSHNGFHQVGQKLPNELDLFDMSGNVWEWCGDHWHDNYEGAPVDGSVWQKEKENSHVVRGGSWDFNGYDCRVSFRNGVSHNYRDGSIGFRVSRY